ncbi:MAG: hypothetical protein IT292_08445 [Deltaproteobacteria bacterium]|nr:hypothetical protein [Deltaproteobacteria bacterium]
MRLASQATALAEARDLAQAATRAKSEFLTNMSHEIRSPLTTILGYIETMLDQGLPAMELVKALSVIQQSGRRLLRLINDLMGFSKIEAGRMDIEKYLVFLAIS